MKEKRYDWKQAYRDSTLTHNEALVFVHLGCKTLARYMDEASDEERSQILAKAVEAHTLEEAEQGQ